MQHSYRSLHENTYVKMIYSTPFLRVIFNIRKTLRYHQLVTSACIFSLHFRAQAWNFVKTIIRMRKVKFGSDRKILLPDVHFTDLTTGVI